MPKLSTLFTLLALVIGTALTAQTRVDITDNSLVAGQTYNWTADNEYVLDGLVYLEAGSVLNIEAGTHIFARSNNSVSTGDNTSALIIARGAQIFARGTASAPIIFTADEDDLNDAEDFISQDRGEWGGLIVLGNATIARPGGEDNIEGIDADETRATFGGTNDADNSGVLRYVSIRHGGSALSPNNEINGLTLGGVGSGTEIDYIEVFANLDDGIEFFGGTVSVNHAAVSFCGDDAFDYDFGFRGTGQYWFSLQAPGDGTGRAGEHDGANPDGQDPFSQPTIYNATYVGIGQDARVDGGDAADENAFAVLFRDNAGGYYRNCIFADFNGYAIAIEDRDNTTEDDSYARFLAGDLGFTNNFFYNFGQGNTAADLVVVVDGDENLLPTQTATISATVTAAGNIFGTPVFNQDDRDRDGNMLDPRPFAFGAAATGAIAADEARFDNTVYFGAFAPGNGSVSPTWIAGWTALDQAQALDGTFLNGVGEIEQDGFLLDAPVPNPAAEQAQINFELPRAAEVTLTVYDILGRPATQLRNRYASGPQSATLNASDLPNGTYLVVLTAEGSRLTQKLSVRR